MDQDTETLKTLAREAARHVPGIGSVEDVAVVAHNDTSDEPAYYFTFLIEPDPDRPRPSLLFVRLGQKIRDELIARGDDSYPYVRIVGRSDWGKHAGA